MIGKTHQSRAFIFDNIPTNITSATYNVIESDKLLYFYDDYGPVTINLLPIGTKWDSEYKLYILDKKGSSGTNIATIYAPVGHLINGKNSITIQGNYESVLIRIVDSSNYIAQFSSASSYPGIIDITYSNFVSTISLSSLIPGAWYRITDFQTVHYILEDPSNGVNTGAIEPILVFAITNETYDKRAISENYREDLIFWDHDSNNFILDQAFSLPLKSKFPPFYILVPGFKGVITYRKDEVNNVEAYYDWRQFLFRRWSLDTTSIAVWNSSTSYTGGTIVQDPIDNCYYLAICDNIVYSPASILNPEKHGGYIKIADINNLYIFPQPNTHTVTLGKDSIEAIIPVDDGDYQDFFTINNFYTAQNISIERRGGFDTHFISAGDEYLFTGSRIANTSVPNIILVTDVGAAIPVGEYPSINCTINGFYSKGNSSLSTFYFRYDSTTNMNHKNIEINSSIGIIFNHLFIYDNGANNYKIIDSLKIEKCESIFLMCTNIKNSTLRNTDLSIFNSGIENSDFNEVTNSTFRCVENEETFSYSSQFNGIQFTNYFVLSEYSRFSEITYVWFGNFETQKSINNCEASSCYNEDYTPSTHIYSTTYDTKIMGTTGASWLLYIDNTGTLQTDLATN